MSLENKSKTGTTLEIEDHLESISSSNGAYACGTSIDKKVIIMTIQYLLIFILVSTYFVYEFVQYNDTTINRKEFTSEEYVETMPKPFLYLALRDHYDCDILIVKSANYTIINSTNINMDYDIIVTSIYPKNYISGYKDTSIDYILSNTAKNDYLLLIDDNTDNKWTEYLVIPPQNESSKVGAFWDSLQCIVICSLENNMSIPMMVADHWDGLMYFTVDHRDTLNNYKTLNDVFKGLFASSRALIPGLFASIQYEWNVIDNQIDEYVYNSYFSYMAYETELNDYWYGFGVSELLEIEPSGRGLKTTTKIRKSYTFYDVISLTGGMFTAISSVLGLIVIYMIWGIGCFNGVASNSFPGGIQQRKFKPFINEIVKEQYEQRVHELEQKIKKLEEIIQSK